jgi:hypothetical protein
VTFVAEPDALVREGSAADVVIGDLNRAGVLEALREVIDVGRRLGFTNHDNVELMQKAEASGIEALPRSRFFRQIAHIVGITEV